MSTGLNSIITLFFASSLFIAVLPVEASGYGFTDYSEMRDYHPYSRSLAGIRRTGALRVKTGITKEGYYARVYLREMDPEGIQVYIRRNRLILEATQGDRYGMFDINARRASRWHMRLRKQLRLPYDADLTRMTTTSVNSDIMEIFIPRKILYQATDPGFIGR